MGCRFLVLGWGKGCGQECLWSFGGGRILANAPTAADRGMRAEDWGGTRQRAAAVQGGGILSNALAGGRRLLVVCWAWFVRGLKEWVGWIIEGDETGFVAFDGGV